MNKIKLKIAILSSILVFATSTLLVVFFILIFSSCDEKQNKNVYHTQKEKYPSIREKRKKQKNVLISERRTTHKIKEAHIDSTTSPKYILRLRLKQSRISFDITEHIKDGMNVIEFEIPVDKEFFDSISIGTKITDEFRVGSFVLNGSFSKWNMTVKDKIIR